MAKRFENWHQPWCVVHGSDALQSLPGELNRLGIDRAYLLTTGSLVRQGTLLDQVRSLLGDRQVGESGDCEQHVPRTSVLRIAEQVRASGATGLIALGGGTVTDTAKGVALVLSCDISEPHGFDAFRVRTSDPQRAVKPALLGDPMPIIALPTTLSAAEYTNIAGIVDTARGSKDLYTDDRLAPRTIILDPRLGARTPPRLWSATGVKVMSDAVEQLYSRFAHPVVDAVAGAGIRRLAGNLANAAAGDAEARTECYVGSWMSLFAVLSAGALPGIATSLRHQIGGVTNAAHSEVAGVLLPHVLRFNLPSAPHALHSLCAAFGVADAGDSPEAQIEEICDVVSTLVRSLSLPARLSDIGVGAEHFPTIAKYAMEDFTGSGNPRAVTSPDELVEVLRAAA